MNETKPVRTIVDLAELAGVSAGTVSRALANSPLISTKTRARIQQLAKDHAFRPNVMAQNFRSRRTGAIGVLIPLGHEVDQSISDPFFITMLGYLADELSARGYDLLLSRIIPQGPDWLDIAIGSGRTDGVILIGQSTQAEVIDRVAKCYTPMVVWGARLPGQVHCSVGSDNRKGGALATRHLIERGCRRIAFFGDPLAPEIAERYEGARMAMREAGLADDLELLPVHLMADVAHDAILSWLRDRPHAPDGIVAASDVIAMSALRACAELGYSVPEQMKIVGYESLSFAAHTNPPLTSISQDVSHGARHLVDLLFRRMDGECTPSVVLEPQLVVRQSS